MKTSVQRHVTHTRTNYAFKVLQNMTTSFSYINILKVICHSNQCTMMQWTIRQAKNYDLINVLLHLTMIFFSQNRKNFEYNEELNKCN